MSARDKLEETEREVARGDAPETPFLVIGGVALAIGAVAAVVIAAALLVWIYG